jgi:seryl-tRNA synthetase
MNHKSDTDLPQEWINLFQAWLLFLPNFFEDHYDEYIHPELLISGDILRKTKYLDHFPQNVFGTVNQSKVLSQFITPAACLHVYPRLEGKKINYFSALITAHCARFEGGKWKPPYRLQDFHMTELVVLGDEKTVSKKKDDIQILLEKTFAEFGFKGNFENATDAFFLGQDNGAKVMQQLKKLKQEYIVKDGKQSIAIASLNSHEEFFSKQFNIKTKTAPAHSFCAAFGVERLTSYSLKIWGKDKNNWPAKFRKYAKIL